MQEPALLNPGAITQFEPLVAVDLPGQQPFAGAIKLDEIVDLSFFKDGRLSVVPQSAVGHQAFVLKHRFHGQNPAVLARDAVAGAEDHPCQRCCLSGVGACLTGGEKQHVNGAVFHAQYGTQAHLQLGRADPALAGNKILHAETSGINCGAGILANFREKILSDFSGQDDFSLDVSGYY